MVLHWRAGQVGTEGQMQPHPWLKPLYRRVATTAACALWVGIESWLEPGGLWFWIALVATAYALWDFFLSGNYADATD
jgi:hypothetical protein